MLLFGQSAPPPLGGVAAEETGAAYTLALADAGRLKPYNRATAQTITIPANATVPIPVGSKFPAWRKGAGLVTFTPAGGVTLNLPTGIRPNRFMGAMVKKSADQTAANYSAGAVMAFDAEEYDTDAFHDPVTNNSRLTIPADLGIAKVVIAANVGVTLATSADWMRIWLLKGGSESFPGAVSQGTEITATSKFGNICNPVPCAAGDIFELSMQQEGDTSVTVVAARTSFSIEVTEIDPVGSIAYQQGLIWLEKIGADEWIAYGPALG